MKLLTLRITNSRGIRDLAISPEGRNVVVFGPNASGKSSVVDAIEFLLTGRISRLTGEGTENITLREHGPHVDFGPSDASVQALFRFNDGTCSDLTRSFSKPGQLVWDPPLTERAKEALAVAARGEHTLKRRDLLRFITATAADRARQVQELLGLKDVEDRRLSLVRLSNKAKQQLKAASDRTAQSRAAAAATCKLAAFTDIGVVGVVNAQRAILGGDPLESVDSGKIKRELEPPEGKRETRPVSRAVVLQHLGSLRAGTCAEARASVGGLHRRLKDCVSEVISDPKVLRDTERLQLTELGMGLIDETGACPLCDKDWPPGELRRYLEQRIQQARQAVGIKARVAELADELLRRVSTLLAALAGVRSTCDTLGLAEHVEASDRWEQGARKLAQALQRPLEAYLGPDVTDEIVITMGAESDVTGLLDAVEKEVKGRLPETSAEQAAWDCLTKLEENLKAVERDAAEQERCREASERATALGEGYVRARDAVLGRLYASVRDRFIRLYQYLHSDEPSFSATLAPDGPGVTLTTNFYGRGEYPPHALHSEGHQDSMGLCLYLALEERLSQGLLDLVVLDDVVMSIDSGHRRSVSRMLKELFPGRQFIITTHDKTWAKQLVTDGVLLPADVVQFYDWNVDTGPRVVISGNLWDAVREDLKRDDIHSAAAQLRHGLEQTFAFLCDSLRADVPYEADARWDLGELSAAALSRYKKLLAKAKNAAQNWGRTVEHETLVTLGERFGQALKDTRYEEWGINPSVHFTEMMNLQRNDFEPIVRAFEELCAFFYCGKCNAMISVSRKGHSDEALRCPCGAINWNLVARKGAGKTC